MAGTGVEIEVIELLQFPYALQRGYAKWSLAVEGVQHDAFQHVAQRHIMVLGKPLQNFQDSFFDPHPRLHALDEKLGIVSHVYQCTKVPTELQAKCLLKMPGCLIATVTFVSRSSTLKCCNFKQEPASAQCLGAQIADVISPTLKRSAKGAMTRDTPRWADQQGRNLFEKDSRGPTYSGFWVCLRLLSRIPIRHWGLLPHQPLLALSLSSDANENRCPDCARACINCLLRGE